jgi:3-deoxy-D-manno-octulosonic-acid transferase
MLWIYSLLLHIMTPLVILKLLWRSRKNPQYRRRIGERFGFGGGSSPEQHGGIWLHCVSVGETLAAVPLAKQLLRDFPDRPLTITTTTPTGSEQVQKIFGDQVCHQYSPYDLGWVVRRFLRRVAPDIIVIMETELWPQLIHQARSSNIPVVVVNARMSEKSRRGYARFQGLTANMLGGLTWMGIQYASDAERLYSLGLARDRATVIGNLKFDMRLPDNIHQNARQLRSLLGMNRPILLGASTHKGEDEELLQAFAQVLVSHPEALLVLVPRHPERFEPVVRLVEESGFEVRRKTAITKMLEPSIQVVVGNTMGELMFYYAVCDAAFVGGSLIEHGGHNPLEPAALAKAICFGPSCHNFYDICHNLVAEGGAVWIDGNKMLAKIWKSWLDNPATANQVGLAAQEFQRQNQGALERSVSTIKQCLDQAAMLKN